MKYESLKNKSDKLYNNLISRAENWSCQRAGRMLKIHFLSYFSLCLFFPCGSAGEESACSAGDLGSIPGLGRSPGEGKGYPLRYSGLESSPDCIVHRAANSRTRLSAFHFVFMPFLLPLFHKPHLPHFPLCSFLSLTDSCASSLFIQVFFKFMNN